MKEPAPPRRPAISTGQKVCLSIVLAVILSAVVITVRFRARPGTDTPETGQAVVAALKDFRPAGWQIAESPLGSTEFAQQEVNRILRFDEATFLTFRNGARDFSLYIAYWGPGKADMRTVNAHTPDTCWVNSGWRTEEKKGQFAGFGQRSDLAPGEYRCYSNQGAIQYVAFWHMLAGRPVKMWRNGFPTLDFMWSVFRGNREALSGEQYFIRISSSRPLAEIWDDPAFAGMLQLLHQTGLTPHANPAS